MEHTTAVPQSQSKTSRRVNSQLTSRAVCQSAHRPSDRQVGIALRQSSQAVENGSRENNTNNFAKLERNTVLEGLHATQKSITTNRRIATCLDMPAHTMNAAVVERADGSVNIEGLARCMNSMCVNCARVRSMEHSAKIGRILTNAQKTGHRVLFGTFGVNNRGSRLDVRGFYDALLGTYQKTFRSRFCVELGIKGIIRSLDFTIKQNGDVNLHWHMLLILEAGIKTDVTELYSRIYQRWADYAHKHAKKTSYSGNDLREIKGSDGISQYLAKQFSPLELVGRDKSSLHSWTLIDLLSLIQESEDKARYIGIYRAIESGLFRTRQIAYTKGCLEFDVELEEKADEETVSEVVSRTELPTCVWMVFRDIRRMIIESWMLRGMARQYLETLCALYWEDMEVFTESELIDHKAVFVRAYARDKQARGLA